eukprot:m.296406 g.296406  ORF g.296406 m.296406 type:complete len:1878 (+) comp15856_c0_seq7:340-5973(+)
MDGISLPAGLLLKRKQNATSTKESARDKQGKRSMAPSRGSELKLLVSKKDVIHKAIDDLSDTIAILRRTAGFEAEFTGVHEEAMKGYTQAKCRAGIANSRLNRYDDIVPFDSNRIVLAGCTPDYVNASLIKNVLPGTPNFIASQGPTKTSVRAFWEVVVQNRVGVIVMVTNVMEGSRVKCEKYWPPSRQSLTLEPTEGYPSTITITGEVVTDGITWSKRVFTVTSSQNPEPLKVSQFHFTDWPDFSAPESPNGFVKFVRVVMGTQHKIQKSIKSADPPLLVHCSAGVGRTGTFIGVYSLLSSLHATKRPSWSVPDIVRSMRKQRVAMVQTATQYEFLYSACLIAADEYVRAAELELPDYKMSRKASKNSKCEADSCPASPTGAGIGKPVVRTGSHAPAPPSSQRQLQSTRSIRKGRSAPSAPPKPKRKTNAQTHAVDAFLSVFTAAPLHLVQYLHANGSRQDNEEATIVLFKLFGSQALLLPLTFYLSEWEVAKCENESLFMRKNSLGSKLLTTTLKTYGQGYLKRTIRPIIVKMLETEALYEINPIMLEKGQNLQTNLSNLKQLVEQFFNAIYDSVASIPIAVQLVCHGISRAMAKRFPSSRNLAVGSCLFLRFFSPAIVQPVVHGIISTQPPPRVQRGLLLASKVLQAVAVGAKFQGFKEEYMECMNGFVNLQNTRGAEYLAKASTLPYCLDEITLNAFATLSMPLSCTVGDPQDLSTLGRRNDGSVVPHLYDTDLESAMALVHRHQEPLRAMLHDMDQEELLDKLDSALDRFGPDAERKVSFPEVWVPKTLTRVERTNTPGDLSRFDTAGLDTMFMSELYPDTAIKRCTVKASQWTFPHANYNPVTYTSPQVQQALAADPDIMSESVELAFNTFDDAQKLDRTSTAGTYAVVKGVPRNPLGRTGIAGRGCLTRWGPNHFTEVLVTRWRRVQMPDGHVQQAFKEKKPVLEVMLLHQESGQLLLPTAVRTNNVVLPFEVSQALGGITTVNPTAVMPTRDATTAKTLKKGAYALDKAIVRDPRNTDNAWVEALAVWLLVCCLHFFISSSLLFCLLTSVTWHVVTGDTIIWAPVHADLAVSERCLELLQQVATAKQAYFQDELPTFLRQVMRLIEQRGLLFEGLYRVSGATSRVTMLKELAFTSGIEGVQDAEVTELTSLLKLLVKEMTPPVVPFDSYEAFMSCSTITVEADRNKAILDVLRTLPLKNFRLLEAIIAHLRAICAQQAENRMTSENLALVFGPTLMRSPNGLDADLVDSGRQITVTRSLIELPAQDWYNHSNEKRHSYLKRHADGKSADILEDESPAPQLPRQSSSAITTTSARERPSSPLATSLTLPETGAEGSTHPEMEDQDGYGSVDSTDDEDEYGSVSSDEDEDDDEERVGGRDGTGAGNDMPQSVFGRLNPSVRGRRSASGPSGARAITRKMSDLVNAAAISVARPTAPVSWFKNDITRDDMVALRDGGEEEMGLFKVYKSKTSPGSYCISVCANKKLWTKLIVRDGSFIHLEEADDCFDSLEALVDYYEDEPLPNGITLQISQADKDLVAQQSLSRAGSASAMVPGGADNDSQGIASQPASSPLGRSQTTISATSESPQAGSASVVVQLRQPGSRPHRGPRRQASIIGGSYNGSPHTRARLVDDDEDLSDDDEAQFTMAGIRTANDVDESGEESEDSSEDDCEGGESTCTASDTASAAHLRERGTFNSKAGFYQDDFYNDLLGESEAQGDEVHDVEQPLVGYDDLGGYYDEYGGYYDNEGGYTDADGNYFASDEMESESTYLEGEVLLPAKGKKFSKDCKTKGRWLRLTLCTLEVFALEDMECEKALTTTALSVSSVIDRVGTVVTVKDGKSRISFKTLSEEAAWAWQTALETSVEEATLCES